MKLSCFSLRCHILAASVLCALILPSAAHAQKPAYMVEILNLKPNASVERAESYFRSVYPIIAFHGLFPVKAYQVSQGNSSTPQIVQIWRIENPEGMPQIVADSNYQWFVSMRDSIFDLKDGRVSYMGSELY